MNKTDRKKLEDLSRDELIANVISTTESLEKLTTEYQKMQAMIHEQQRQYNVLLEQFKLFQKNRYGKKTEKTSSMFETLSLFNETEFEFDNKPEEQEEEEEIPVAAHTRKKKAKETDWEKYVTKTVHDEIKDNICPDCGGKLVELKSKTWYEIIRVPAKVEVIKHIQHQYTCKHCGTKEHPKFFHGAHPKKLITASPATPELIASTVVDKYMMHIPLNRQEMMYAQMSLPINRAKLSDWLMKVADKIFIPMTDLMHKHLISQDYLHMDETTLRVVGSDNEKDYVWVMCTDKWNDKPCVVFFYGPSRKYEVAEDLIGSVFSGTITSDAYGAYKDEDKLYTNALCWAHARRYVVEALEVSPIYEKYKKAKSEEQRKIEAENPGFQILCELLRHINKLFDYERAYEKKKLSTDQIKERRQIDQQPIIDELYKIVDENLESFGSGKSRDAIHYLSNNRVGLTRYLEDGRLVLTNSIAERAIRPFTTGRKNWLFCQTESGADSSTAYFSIIETAKMNHLKVFDYLVYVMKQVTETEQTDKEFLTTLLPFSETLPAELKAKDK